MAYAILKTGGKQYRVRPGDVIDVDKLPVEPGSSIELGDILAVSKDDGIVLGSPVVANASVLANVQDQIRDDKIIVFKYKRKVRYRVKRGHRQPYTRIAITAIMLDGEDVGSQAPVDVIAPEDVELEQPVDEADAVEDTVDESEEPDAESEAAEDETAEAQDVEEDAGEASDEADGEEESGNGS
jgi:large subunit ribosomal protein L21